MTGENQTAFRIRLYREEDEPAVLSLLHTAFGRWPDDVDVRDPTELFRWKHMANPLGRSVMVVAEADGTLIGFAAWVLWRMSASGQTFAAFRGVDLAVHPRHRRKGVAAALTRDGINHFPKDAAFTFSEPNELRRSGSLKGGTAEVGAFPLLVRLRAPLRTAARLIDRNSRTMAVVHAESAAEALRDHEGVAALLAHVEQSDVRLSTVKDPDYLAWRYGGLPYYRAIREHRDGRLAGLAIFRVRSRGRSLVTNLCELLVPPGDRATSRRLLHRVVHAAAVDYIICHFPAGSTARQAAMRCGFLRLRSGPVPTLRRIRDDITPDPGDRRSWAICLGDLDLL
ncbi:MAG: GNAT family N-acetyltransferase [Actinomycetota bacterium]|nr:GNAT family N-acetyltransferase [Actinomycetota bacterium]